MGFEPTAEHSPAAVFETAPIVHSGTFPPDIIAQAPEPSKSILTRTLDKVHLIRLQNRTRRCIIGLGSAPIYNGVRGNAGVLF